MDEILSDINTESWLTGLLAKAIDLRASDIHIEITRDILSVRFRIDGILYLIETLNKESHKTIIAHIKIVAQLDSMDFRLPQDGHFEFTHNNHIFNIRVSTFPTIYGEVVVMRILNREDILLKLGDLGFDNYQLEIINNLIHEPYGMILITGPSGSGKTTLLYSALNVLNKPSINIITIEDPTELQIDGMRQSQVNESSEFKFATALRSVLRQDPDIIMVGEIRDDETAQIAIQAALTGRLVFSTFHTLNVPAVVTRLIEMGIPQSVVANAIAGVISTRLVRKICPDCKVPYQLSEEEKKMLGEDLAPEQAFYKGIGCGKCLKSGYFGRTGIFEIIPFDEEIRFGILEKLRLSEMAQTLQKKEIKSLRQSALDKACQGLTTAAEVIRVTSR